MRYICLGIALCFSLAAPLCGQELEDLRGELRALREEVELLRGEIQRLRGEIGRESDGSPAADLAESQKLVAAKVEEQHQTKVESGSKYHVRLSGMALLSGFHTSGRVDDVDVARSAETVAAGEARGSFAATVRQSLVRLDVDGPRWVGARTSGDLEFDFFGGFPVTPEGVTAGLLRLRSASVRLDWKQTSLVAGQDTPFFSPLSPTSLAATAYPALSSAGNLWTWTPQVYVERELHRSAGWRIALQAGVLDALTGELPVTEYDRTPNSGENSRMPAYATRISVQQVSGERTASWGAGAYYARQNWSFGRTVDSWLATSDWDLPLGRNFSFSGEFYRGRGIGGLGGGATGSVVFSGATDAPDTRLFPVSSTGGWAQFKFQPADRLEFNAAFGKDASSLSALAAAPGLVHDNASGFVNVIYKPRSNLLFSVEYRRLWTSRYFLPFSTANLIGGGAGILF